MLTQGRVYGWDEMFPKKIKVFFSSVHLLPSHSSLQIFLLLPNWMITERCPIKLVTFQAQWYIFICTRFILDNFISIPAIPSSETCLICMCKPDCYIDLAACHLRLDW